MQFKKTLGTIPWPLFYYDIAFLATVQRKFITRARHQGNSGVVADIVGRHMMIYVHMHSL
jgi:hypothetical protein